MSRRQFRSWVFGWCNIIDGIFLIVTLGMWHPGLAFRWIAYDTIRELKKPKER